MKKKKIFLTLLCGLAINTTYGQTLMPQMVRQTVAHELMSVSSYVGTIDQLFIPSPSPTLVPLSREEAHFMEAFSLSRLDDADAEHQLLAFIEQYPHSAYLPYAEYRLGVHYYLSGNYPNAVHWFQSYDASLLPTDMSQSSLFLMGYALIHDQRYREALSPFRALLSSSKYGRAANFYVGYLLLREGTKEEARSYLNLVINDPIYGKYALAYLADSYLADLDFIKALSYSERALADGDIKGDLERSLYRSAGLAASNLGRKELGIDYLQKYISLSEGSMGRLELLVLGKDLFELGHYAKSIDYLNRSVQGGESDFMAQLAYYYMGLSQLSLNNVTAAITDLGKAKEMTAYAPITESSFFNWALALYSKTPGKLGQGCDELVAFVNTYPNSEYTSRAFTYIIDAALHDGDNDRALAMIDKVSHKSDKLIRTRSQIALRRANNQLSNGETAAASKSYDDIISANNDPHSVAQALFWKGELAYRNGNYQETVRATTRALEVQPQDTPIDPQAYYNLGYAYYALSQWDKAREWFSKYLSVASPSAINQRSTALARLGDIAVMQREYTSAITAYRESEETGGKSADYALFKRAMTEGLLKHYKVKADLLATLSTRYPASSYVADALFERGRALSLAGNESAATAEFKHVFENYPNSKVTPKAGIRLALAYFNDNRLEEASQIYKNIIRQYPNSDEAKSAFQDLKSISIQLNKVDEYTKFLSQVKGGHAISHSEEDSLSYLAAERVVAQGNLTDAQSAIDKYLTAYPDGIFVNKATYNKAYILYKLGSYEASAEILRDLAPKVSSSELSLDLNHLLISCYEKLGDNAHAAEVYVTLAKLATNISDRSSAISSALDRADSSNSDDFIVGLAGDILQKSILVDEATQAKAYGLALALADHRGQQAQALTYAQTILSLPHSPMTARAEVIKATAVYNQGKYASAQKMIKSLIDKGTTDTYWLARAFILLADTYDRQGDKNSAKVYLESLKSNYTKTDDDILGMVQQRLDKIKMNDNTTKVKK